MPKRAHIRISINRLYQPSVYPFVLYLQRLSQQISLSILDIYIQSISFHGYRCSNSLPNLPGSVWMRRVLYSNGFFYWVVKDLINWLEWLHLEKHHHSIFSYKLLNSITMTSLEINLTNINKSKTEVKNKFEKQKLKLLVECRNHIPT